MIIEPVRDFLSGQDTNPCRGQLDSQGDAVYFAHDRLDRSSDILAQLEPCLHMAGPIGESRAASDAPVSLASPRFFIYNGSTCHTSSPSMSSGERLVARIATDGHL